MTQQALAVTNNQQVTLTEQQQLTTSYEQNKSAVQKQSSWLPKEQLEFYAGMIEGAQLYQEDSRLPANVSKYRTMAKIACGYEVGFSPMTAMNFVDIIQGKPKLNGAGQACLLSASGKYNYLVAKLDNEECVLKFFRRASDGQWKLLGLSSFNTTDARLAGLLDGKNAHTWKKYPRNMRFWRAMTNGVKFYCPDILPGHIQVADIEDTESLDFTTSLPQEVESNVKQLTTNPTVPAQTEKGDEVEADFVETQSEKSEREENIELIENLLQKLSGGDQAERQKLLKEREINTLSDQELLALLDELSVM